MAEIAPPNGAEDDGTLMRTAPAGTDRTAFSDRMGACVRRPHWLAPTLVPTPVTPPLPVAFFAEFVAAAIITTPPALFVYLARRLSLFFEPRQEIVFQGVAPVLEGALSLCEAEGKAAADPVAEKRRTKVAAASRGVAFKSV